MSCKMKNNNDKSINNDHGIRKVNRSWCIHLDQHELGFIVVPDEEFIASLHPEPMEQLPDTSDTWLSEDKWVDPRKGDLFALVQSLQSREEKCRRKK